MKRAFPVNRLLAIGFVLLMGGCSLPPIINYLKDESRKDYPLWYATGQLVVHNLPIYPEAGKFPFMYPPIAAILLAPLTCAGELVLVLSLVTINSLAWMTSVALCIYLATGRVSAQHPILYLLTTSCSAAFAFDTYLLGQPNLLLLALMLGAFACLRIGREWGAGALVALAAGIKAFPLMAVGYLVYRRHWRAVASLVATLVLFFAIVPVVVRGPSQGVMDVQVWARGMLFNYNDGSIGQRTERAYSWKNQSLVGLANRFLRHKLADEDPDSNYYVNVLDLDFRSTNAIVLTIALSLCLCYISAMPRQAARTPLSNAIEYALLLLLILLFSPYTFGYFFVWLMYPYAILLHLCLQAPHGSTRRRYLAAAFVAAVLLMTSSLVSQRAVETHGNFFFATLLLFGVLSWELSHLDRNSPTALQESGNALSGLPSFNLAARTMNQLSRQRWNRT